MGDLKLSIDRATALLQTPPKHTRYLSVRLEPSPERCCCFHCWPGTWNEVNERLARESPMRDEGDLLVPGGTPATNAVLQCHESGPEVVVYLAVATASLALAKSVADIILLLLNARQRDPENPTPHLRMVARYMKHDGSVHEEATLHVSLPVDASSKTEVLDCVARSIEKLREDRPDPDTARS